MPLPSSKPPRSGTAPPGQLSALLRELACDAETPGGAGWEAALRPGAVVDGRFELVRELGRGGFGVVYQARDRETGDDVAFKAVRAGDRQQFREERLLREADAAAQVNHPNVVAVHHVGRSEHGPYLVMELLQGQPLGRRLALGRLGVREAVRVAVEVARGLARAHESGVVHRDLTPGNVFMCEDGRVKVLDLGMAHAFGQRLADGGTPGHMAPEQWRRAPEDERTDVFALGVLIHQMLTGALPFPASRPPHGTAPALRVPGAAGLAPLVARMLAADPVERPRDAGEVLPALEDLQRELEHGRDDGRLAWSRWRPPRWAVLGVAAGLLGFLVAAFAPRIADWFRPPSVAVLPFADLSPQHDQEYFADGLASDILKRLARVEGLRVPSRASCFYFKGKQVKLADVGRELGVRAVLAGSVHRSGNRVRVQVALAAAEDGRPLWKQDFDAAAADVLEVEEDVVRGVVGALGLRAVPAPGTGAPPRAPVNPEAYAQVLLGQQLDHRLGKPGLAVEAFERAVKLDPSYATAWAGLAMALFSHSDAQPDAEAVATMQQRALAVAETAVALQPDLPEALSARGFLRAHVAHDWAGARADLEHAVALGGGASDVRRRYGAVLASQGLLEEAVEQVRAAAELDPLGPSRAKLAVLLQAQGDLDGASRELNEALRTSPGNPTAAYLLARNLLLKGRLDEAEARFAGLGSESLRLWGRAAVAHSRGQAARSRAALEALISAHAHTAAVEIAEVLAWRGQLQESLAWLERARAEGNPRFSAFLRHEPFLSGLRGDPRLEALLARSGFPAAAPRGH